MAVKRLFLTCLMLLPGALWAQDMTCEVRFSCQDGACQSAERAFETRIDPLTGGIAVEWREFRKSLVQLDRTSGGDLIFGGQFGTDIYGVFILRTSGTFDLILEGVNGWTESRNEIGRCRAR